MTGIVLAAALVATWAATPMRAVDGDTLTARVTVWPRQEITLSIRIRGIDTPERRGKCAAEREAAERARAALQAQLDAAGTVYLQHVTEDAYAGRMDARVLTPAGEDIGAAMLVAGHAVTMGSKRTKDWCKEDPK